MRLHVTVDTSHAMRELDRLARGPSPVVGQFEGILSSSFMATQAMVHVITGYLKSSGHITSSFDGDTWSGTISYARHPGIFELARGNTPSKYQAGSHFFLEPGYDTPHAYEDAVESFLRG